MAGNIYSRNSGLSFIGIFFSLLIIAILTITLVKNIGIYDSRTTDSKNIKDPVEKTKAIECTIKVEALKNEVKIYKINNEEFPKSLDKITDDFRCPISGIQFQYNQITGKVWCPNHDQG